MGDLLHTVWHVILLIGGTVVSALGIAAIFITVLDIYQIRTQVLSWIKRREELQASIKMLNVSDHFIADVIQLGGEFSRTYTLTVRVDEEGGYYLNPPSKFVSVFFNRGGDLILVSPSDFVRKYGHFQIQHYSTENGDVIAVREGSICGLPIPAMRNRYSVRFVRH